MSNKARSSQLFIVDDTLYHIHLKREYNIPPNILIMGADSRVDEIMPHFNTINFVHRNPKRSEFYTIVGTYKGVPIAAISIGIGVDNMEIAINELHALFEYDHETDTWTKEIPKVNIIRIGTCGTSMSYIQPGKLIISDYALGLDNLGAYYPVHRKKGLLSGTGLNAKSVGESWAAYIEKEFLKTKIGKVNPLSYCAQSSPAASWALIESVRKLGESRNTYHGITTASPGFFSPEGRQIGRIQTAFSAEEFKEVIQKFNPHGPRIINHEMETSVLFRLGYEHLGYNVGAICLVIDNLATDEVLANDTAKQRMNACARVALEALVNLSKN